MQAGGERLVRLALAVQRLLPVAGDVGVVRVKALRQAVQVVLNAGRHAGLQRAGFARQAGQRGFDSRLQCGAGGAGAAFQAVFQRPAYRRGQPGVGRFGLLVKALLPGQQAFLQGAVLRLQLGGQRLQALGQQGQRLGLLAHQRKRFLTLEGGRIGAQRGGGARVQLLAGQQAFAPRQRRQQPQHGRGGHAREGGAERHAQPHHRRGQRSAHGGQIGRALQRLPGAAQGDDHARKGAQHAQQHQQAGQVGRQAGGGQAGALAFHALAHGLAQGRVDLVQPVGQRGRGLAQAGQGAGQRLGGLAVAVKLRHADQEERADQHGDGQRQRVAARVARAHPQHGDEAGQRGQRERGG